MHDFDKKETHESYGLIQFSRISHGGRYGCPLFGSSIRHGHLIRMRVTRASLNRSLSHDWYHDEESIVELDLSLSQFVEAISTMNASGIPCTLRYVDGKQMEDPPYKSKRDQFEGEFKEDCEEVATRIDGLERFAKDLLAKPSVTKDERKALVEQIRMLRQQIESNMPFVVASFNEQMDKTVMEAKGEVEAFVQHRIVAAGLEAVKGQPLVAIPDQRQLDEG